eukprot:3458261-Alexandrium_andersonii.AAC.1
MPGSMTLRMMPVPYAAKWKVGLDQRPTQEPQEEDRCFTVWCPGRCERALRLPGQLPAVPRDWPSIWCPGCGARRRVARA